MGLAVGLACSVLIFMYVRHELSYDRFHEHSDRIYRAVVDEYQKGKWTYSVGIPYATLHTWRHTFASYVVMRSGNIRVVQKLLGHSSIKTTEIYSHLSDRHLHTVVRMPPGPDLGPVLGIPEALPGKGIVQVVENKVVGDAGLEPATSTV